MSQRTEGLRKAARRVFWEASQIDKVTKETRWSVADEALSIVHMLDVCRYSARSEGFTEEEIRVARLHALDDLLIELRDGPVSDERILRSFDAAMEYTKEFMAARAMMTSEYGPEIH